MDILLLIGLPVVGVTLLILISAGASALYLKASCRIRNMLFAGNSPARAVKVPSFGNAFEIGVDLLLLMMVITALGFILGFVIGRLVGGGAAIPASIFVGILLQIVSFCCQSSIIAEGIDTNFSRAAGVNFFYYVLISFTAGIFAFAAFLLLMLVV